MTGGAHAGSNIGDAIRKGVGMIHGAGEGIRGNFNAAVDSASGDREAAARDEAIASRGAEEMEHGYHRTHRTGQGEHGLSGSTNYGPHETNVGNKLDPRYDSDVDHRGTTQGSTNHGPHNTNVGNKLDPRYDSDLDGRGTAQGSTNYGPHSTNIGNKADPRVDSDLSARFDGSGSTNYGPHSTYHGNDLDPRYDSDQDHRGLGHGSYGSTNYGPHSSNVGNKLDPRYDSDLDHRGTVEGSTNYGPHPTNLANKLDPRYDSDMDHRGHMGSISTLETDHYQPQPTHRSGVMNALETRAEPGYVGTSYEEPMNRTNTFTAPQRRDTDPMPHLHHHCPPGGEEKLERYDRRSSKSHHPPHANQFLNLLDPRVDSSAAKKHGR